MESKVEILGLNVHYKTLGEGSDVLLLHGWGCNTETFLGVQTQLAKKYRVTSIDFPGFGQSDEPKEVWGVEQYTQLTEQLIQKLNLIDPVLIGHSFGGRVSILLSSRNNNIKKVILTDAAGVKPNSTKISMGKIFGKVKSLTSKVLGEKLTNKLVSPIAKKMGSADYNAASPMMKEIIKKVVDQDLQEFMPKISASTLLIWGSNDTATPLEDAKIMESLIPDAGLVVINGAGHFSFLEQPAFYLSVVENFLSSK